MDEAAQGQWLQTLTTLGFVCHIAAGSVGLGSGLIAVFAPKGGRLHQVAGSVFFGAMLVMAAFAAYLAVVRPGQIVNLFIAAFTAYLVVTAWLTVRRRVRVVGRAEGVALAVAVILFAPFALLAFALATGMTLPFKSAFAFKGPILVAIYIFTSVLAIAVVGDARLLLAGGISGLARVARHLWRMCLGLILATGSFFTNALPRILPPHSMSMTAMFLPQFLLLGLLIFWLIRVRVPGWRMARREAPARA